MLHVKQCISGLYRRSVDSRVKEKGAFKMNMSGTLTRLMSGTALAILAASVCAATPARAQTAPPPPQPLTGFVDMHTHPMSHLGFGGMIMYGAPDTGSLMLAGQKYRGGDLFKRECNTVSERAGTLEDALGNDNALHGSWGAFDNDCGDVIRSALIDDIERVYVHEVRNSGLAGEVNDHPHSGYPNFAHWPHWSTVTHQQMYWEWIKRSFDGGQRVMVALAVNNSLLAKAANATQYVQDKSSVKLQLEEIKQFVARHSDFMEIAITPEQLRRIVQSNRMAVILGVETDDFGDLTRRSSFAGEDITPDKVDDEIRLLYGLGVRYILPIHFADSVLGGYAIKDPLFALSSKEYANRFATPVETCGQGIHFDLKRADLGSIPTHLLRTRDLGRILDTQPDYSIPGPDCGHMNSRGLTPLGRGAINTMMDLGMMIDIDHMSRRTVEDVLAIAQARDYPVNSGHNGLLADDCRAAVGGERQHCTESQRTEQQYAAIRSLGGMVGLGHGGKATNFVREYQRVLELMGNAPVAIGTDANGLEPLPAPDPLAPVRYGADFPQYRFAARTWDFNVDGFAHYGLFPDYIRSWQASTDPATRMTDRAMNVFMSSAEGFARMWEKSVRRAAGTPHQASVATTTTWCDTAGATTYQGDFNGDGSADLLCLVPVYTLGTGAGGVPPGLPSPTRPTVVINMSIDYADSRGVLAGAADWSTRSLWCTQAGAVLQLGDFNGDGRTDLLCSDRRSFRIDYADADGRFAREDWSRESVWCSHAGSTLHAADVNGDGRTDLQCRDSNTLWIDYADGAGQFTGVDWARGTTWCTHAGAALQMGDFNGDGRTDLLCSDRRSFWIDYADANGQFAREDWFRESVWCSHAGSTLHAADVNGDGRTDLLCRDRNTLWIDYADGAGQFSGVDWARGTTWCSSTGATLRLADVNGDGRTDMLCRAGSTLRIDYADAAGRFDG